MAKKNELEIKTLKKQKFGIMLNALYVIKLAECKSCRKVFKCEGGSTNGLHVHLRSTHQIDLLKSQIMKKSTWKSVQHLF